MMDHELFDRLPDVFFKGLRERMMLGMVPSETVDLVLGPVLMDYEAIASRLSLRIRNDIDDILRLYPEIAERYGVEPRPGLTAVLESLRAALKGLLPGPPGSSGKEGAYGWPGGAPVEGDFVMEMQKGLNAPPAVKGRLATGCFTTNRGKEAFLLLSFEEGTDRLRLESPGLEAVIEIRLWGRRIANLRPDENGQDFELDDLSEVFAGNEGRDIELEVVETEESPAADPGLSGPSIHRKPRSPRLG